jgi:hypothetical protein
MTQSYFATISIVSLANSTLVDNRSCVTAARESVMSCLNTVVVCSTMRVDNMLWRAVCSLREQRDVFCASSERFARRLTLGIQCTDPDSSSFEYGVRSATRIAIIEAILTETLSTNPTFRIPITTCNPFKLCRRCGEEDLRSIKTKYISPGQTLVSANPAGVKMHTDTDRQSKVRPITLTLFFSGRPGSIERS